MAYSSLHPYVNEIDVPDKRRSDGAIKRYESAIDSRAWSANKLEKSTFIHDVVKRKATTSQLPCRLSEAVRRFDVVSREDLVEQIKCLCFEIKTKDIELDKIHKLFKQTSKKLENMDDILNFSNRQFEALLKDSQVKLEKLKNEQKEKDRKLTTLEKQVSELKCSPSVQIDVNDAWESIKNRADLYDDVVKERNALKDQLCKMSGAEDLLKKLKIRADEADRMEQEILNLRRDLQRFSNGAAGDVVSRDRSRATSPCGQCRLLRCELQQKDDILDCETKKNIVSEAEGYFLRERVRSLDVMEAELIMYKTKFEDAVNKMMTLKETLVRAENCEKQVRESKQRFEEIQSQLIESERHTQELTNVVERQEIDLKERDTYIDCITRRLQQEFDGNSLKRVMSAECVKPGSVQQIVRQLNVPAIPTNCKCGFENCECLNGTHESSSNIIKQRIVKFDGKSEMVPSSSPSSEEVLKEKKELSQLQSELSTDEIRLLRQQNSELDSELKRYKKELAGMTELLNQLDNQRNSNCMIEEELNELKIQYDKDVECMRTSFQSSNCEKNEEICCLRRKLNDELCKVENLEQNMTVCCQELQELRPFREKFAQHCAKLRGAEADAKKLEALQCDCDKFFNDNQELNKKLLQKENEAEEQRKYAKILAEQLSNRSSQIEKSSESVKKREILIKSIKDLKNQYDTLKDEKLEVIATYEKKLKSVGKNNEGAKTCACDCRFFDCNDILLGKIAKCGIESLRHDELVDLHNRVRCAMMQVKKSLQRTTDTVPLNFYTRVADEIRVKHNFYDSLPFMRDTDFIPTKDVDTGDSYSSKTMPSILRSQNRRSYSKHPTGKQRARSTETCKPKKSLSKARTKN